MDGWFCVSVLGLQSHAVTGPGRGVGRELQGTEGFGTRLDAGQSLTASFLSPCSPNSNWKSPAPDRSDDDEHDPLDTTSRPRYTHSYLSDSDTEARPTETHA